MKIDILESNILKNIVKRSDYMKGFSNVLDNIQKLVKKNDIVFNIIVKKK